MGYYDNEPQPATADSTFETSTDAIDGVEAQSTSDGGFFSGSEQDQ